MPFYRRLGAAVTATRTTALVIGSREPLTVTRDYLRTNRVAVSMTLELKGEPLRIPGTPALLLIDNRGRIVESWYGLLDSATETKVLRAIS